jgi:hypothetical protein
VLLGGPELLHREYAVPVLHIGEQLAHIVPEIERIPANKAVILTFVDRIEND